VRAGQHVPPGAYLFEERPQARFECSEGGGASGGLGILSNCAIASTLAWSSRAMSTDGLAHSTYRGPRASQPNKEVRLVERIKEFCAAMAATRLPARDR